MIKLQWANEFGGVEKNLIDLQPWQQVKLRGFVLYSHIPSFYIAHMSISQVSSSQALTEISLRIPDEMGTQMEVEIPGDQVGEFLFTLWLAIEHRRGGSWAKFIENARRRGIRVRVTFEQLVSYSARAGVYMSDHLTDAMRYVFANLGE